MCGFCPTSTAATTSECVHTENISVDGTLESMDGTKSIVPIKREEDTLEDTSETPETNVSYFYFLSFS